MEKRLRYGNEGGMCGAPTNVCNGMRSKTHLALLRHEFSILESNFGITETNLPAFEKRETRDLSMKRSLETTTTPEPASYRPCDVL